MSGESEDEEAVAVTENEEVQEDTETLVLSQWAMAEDEAPTDPCRTLRVHWSDTPAQLNAVLAKRLLQIGRASHGAAKFLKERCRRAHALITDVDRAAEFHRERTRQIDEGTWASLKYPNGLYEGAVETVFTEDLETELHRVGRGITIVDSGDKYEGAYANDERHGQGVQLWGNGDVYVGEWSEDAMHGLGVYYYGSGSTYSGQFERGLRHGRGRLAWRNKSVYDGEFHRGMRTGHGVLELRDGHGTGAALGIYRGEFKDGLRHGQGRYEPANPQVSTSYVGQFVEDRLEGEGEAHFPNGAHYKGGFFDGVPQGKGVYRWSENNQQFQYEGQMKRGRISGRGKMDFAGRLFHSGPPRGWRVTYEGNLFEGQPDGYGELSGDMEYTGSWRKGLRDGRGSCSWPGGECRYVGQFVEDQRHGHGRLIWRNGPTWEGNFEEDLRHGPARWSANSEEHTEKWRYGSLIMRDDVPCLCHEVNDLEADMGAPLEWDSGRVMSPGAAAS